MSNINTGDKFPIQISSSATDPARGKCVLVHFNYHEELVKLIKGVPSAIWMPDYESWELRYPMVRVFLYRVKRYIARLNINPVYYISEDLRGMKEEFDLKDIEFKTTPYNYQIEGIQYMLKNKRCILGDEPGCISGDAIIPVLISKNVPMYDGKVFYEYMKLKDLYEMWKTKTTDIYICTIENGVIKYKKPVDILDSGSKKVHELKCFYYKAGNSGKEVKLKLTPDHEVLTPDGWVRAEDLKSGDIVIGVNSICQRDETCFYKVISNSYIANETYRVYDIKFDGPEHNFIADNIVVHNCGKTLQLMYTALALRKYEGLKHVLIICGVNGNKYNWQEEVIKHTNLNAHILGTRRSTRTGRLIDKGTAALIDDLRNPTSATFWIINVEKLRMAHKKRKRGQRKTISEFPIVELIQGLIDKGEIGLVAFDEFHKCISGDSDIQVKVGSPRGTIRHMTMKDVFDEWNRGTNLYVKSLSARGNYCYQKIDFVHRNIPSEQFYKITYGTRYSDVRYTITISESHKVYIPAYKDYMEAGKLRVGNEVGVSTAKWLRGVVHSIEPVNFKDEYCYDLDVHKTHCYFANNLLIHNCKQPTSLQSQALLWINCPREVAMTGTLIVNSPLDLFMPFKWLGLEARDYWAFMNRYAVKDSWGSVIGYQNAQELVDVLAVYQLRRLKKNVIELPPKVHIDEMVELSANEWKVYRAVQTGLMDLLEGDETNPEGLKKGLFRMSNDMNPMTLSMRLRQCTADTSIVSDVIKESSKMNRMEELCKDIIENGEKVIIFSNWSTVTNIAKDRLSRFNPAYITGEVKDEIRNQERIRFQEDDNCKIMIGTSTALGTGFTLTAATNVIFLDEPWTQAVKNQCEDRCHRVGTKSTVTIYTLIAKDTVDEHVHDIVENKGDIADLVIDGVVNPSKKDQLIRILLGADQYTNVRRR